MKNKQIAFFALLLVLLACTPSQEKVYNFNTKLVGVNNSLQGDMTGLNTVVENVLKSRDFSTLSFRLNNTKSDLSRYEAEIKKYPTPTGGEAFKTAVLEYIKVVKDITDVYTDLSKLPKAATEEEINAILDKADKLYQTEEAKMKAAQAAQEEFAKANKLPLK